MLIKQIIAREIIDSRGNPTIEADVILDSGIFGRASVPSGASTGSREAHELRDKVSTYYRGLGVQQAVDGINNEINATLTGMDVSAQINIDKQLCQLDGTDNKSRLGANALLAVSMGVMRARCNAEKKPLYQLLNQGQEMCMPVPMMNILNGGMHADNNLDIQEFMIMPVGASNFPMALQMGVETFHALKSILKQQGLSTTVGDEGGFAPDLRANAQALDILVQAVEQTGLSLGKDIVFCLDVAASELYHDGYYHLNSERKKLSADELVDYYHLLIKNYPVVSIEDGIDEGDTWGWQQLTQRLGQQVQLVGDDLFVTNATILQQGINQQLANAILIKLNQIGTLTETLETIALAQKNNYRCIISHRSGETEDTFIADLAVASGCGQIKTGSLCRTDRVAKYNQLMRIYSETKLAYPGLKVLLKP